MVLEKSLKRIWKKKNEKEIVMMFYIIVITKLQSLYVSDPRMCWKCCCVCSERDPITSRNEKLRYGKPTLVNMLRLVLRGRLVHWTLKKKSVIWGTVLFVEHLIGRASYPQDITVFTFHINLDNRNFVVYWFQIDVFRTSWSSSL